MDDTAFFTWLDQWKKESESSGLASVFPDGTCFPKDWNALVRAAWDAGSATERERCRGIALDMAGAKYRNNPDMVRVEIAARIQGG